MSFENMYVINFKCNKNKKIKLKLFKYKIKTTKIMIIKLIKNILIVSIQETFFASCKVHDEIPFF